MISPADILNGGILIVDDNEANVSLLEEMLRGAGYSCITPREIPTRSASCIGRTIIR
jgi:hypothetical protein